MEVLQCNALDILASVVSNLHETNAAKRVTYQPPQFSSTPQEDTTPAKKSNLEHRVSCHRCGNIRKRKILCPRDSCPHIFCGRCADKMKEEHGEWVFNRGCPVCQDLCCCSNKSFTCDRKNHCYRKCPATKTRVSKPLPPPTNERSNHSAAPALDILAHVVSSYDAAEATVKRIKTEALPRPLAAPVGNRLLALHNAFPSTSLLLNSNTPTDSYVYPWRPENTALPPPLLSMSLTEEPPLVWPHKYDPQTRSGEGKASQPDKLPTTSLSPTNENSN